MSTTRTDAMPSLRRAMTDRYNAPLTTSTWVFAGTSYIFLACILGLVMYLTITKTDQTPPELVLADAASR